MYHEAVPTTSLTLSQTWRCPACRSEIREDDDRLVCSSCSRAYALVGGIPDFRVNLPNWIDVDSDRRKALHLLSLGPSLSARDLTTEVFRQRGWSDAESQRRTHLSFALTSRLEQELDEWLRDATSSDLPFLDLGCGSGPLLAAAAARGRPGVGIDVSLEWLVVAQRHISERGGTPVLAAALGESLPFGDGSFGGTVSLDVIEHVGDQCGYLREISRVLAPGGTIALSTPNRFSVSAEPHVSVWGVGWLPRPWQKPYAEWRSGKPYDFVRLLSVAELRRMLHGCARLEATVLLPPIPAAEIAQFRGVKAACARVYNRLLGVPPLRTVIVGICPFFRVIASKPR